MSNTNALYDVVIIGLGPAGATLAHLLGLCGVHTLVIEKEAAAYHLPRAVHFDAEVMRVFQTIGISDELKEKLIVNKGMKFIDADGKLLLDWPRPQEVGPQGWHASYRFHQPDLEEILRSHLTQYAHVTIRTLCNLVALKEEENEVIVTYQDLKQQKTETVRTKYLVGCDGARSFVRNQIQPDMHDLGFDERWLVIDVLLKKEMPELGDFTLQHCRPERPASYAKGPKNRRRWEITVLEHEDSEEIASEDSVWQLLSQWISPQDATLERAAVYTFHSTIAQQWHKGRLFIAGDAAHLTPPFMGQGMCAGIRDVANLAWKLALCVKNKHSDTLLDSYESERIPHVEAYISTAVRLGGLINTCGTQAALKAAFPTQDGAVRMESLNVKLGAGLTINSHDSCGYIAAQPKIAGTTFADDIAGYGPILFIRSALYHQVDKALTPIIEKMPLVCSEGEPEVEAMLAHLGVQAAVVRPDRYILGTANTMTELIVLLARTPPSALENKTLSERLRGEINGEV